MNSSIFCVKNNICAECVYIKNNIIFYTRVYTESLYVCVYIKNNVIHMCVYNVIFYTCVYTKNNTMFCIARNKYRFSESLWLWKGYNFKESTPHSRIDFWPTLNRLYGDKNYGALNRIYIYIYIYAHYVSGCLYR